MPKLESVRTTAEAIGRITCIKTGKEIGLLYQWDNGDTQSALYNASKTSRPSTPLTTGHKTPRHMDGD